MEEDGIGRGGSRDSRGKRVGIEEDRGLYIRGKARYCSTKGYSRGKVSVY